MALILKDRVRETTTVTGTGAATLLGAVTGYQAFSVVGNTNTCYYTIADQSGPNWEVGTGTYSTTGPTLTRTTILASSNGGSAVNFTSGTKDVFLTYPSEKAVYQDANGNVLPSTFSSLTDSALTSGRVTYAGTGGLLQDSSVFTFDGTTIASTKFAGAFNGSLGATTPSTAVVTSLTDSGLTTGRVTYATTAGLLTDSANLTFNGTTLTSTGFAGPINGVVTSSSITDSGLTSGRVTYATTGGLLTDSANLTFNGTTLAVTGAITATTDSSFTSTGALRISKGTTAEQPGSAVTGMMRYNSTTNQFEGYSGASPAWKSIGGSAVSNDTATATNLYPLFAAATTGTAENVYTSNAKYLYKPSTGELQASAIVATNGLVLNSSTVATSYTIATGNNAMSVGPITVASGQSVTVSPGQRWVIL